MQAVETLEEFQGAVGENSGKVLAALFTAPWGGAPQKELQALLTELKEEAVHSVHVDMDEEDAQEIALEMGVQEVPSLLFFKGGMRLQALTKPTLQQARGALQALQVESQAQTMMRDAVRASYAATVTGSAGCCQSVSSLSVGYTKEQLQAAGQADLGLGCGTPLAFAHLKPGKFVLSYLKPYLI